MQAGLDDTYRVGNIGAKYGKLDIIIDVGFSLKLINNHGDNDIGAAECYDDLREEIEMYNHGGRTTMHGLSFETTPGAFGQSRANSTSPLQGSAKLQNFGLRDKQFPLLEGLQLPKILDEKGSPNAETMPG
ncbi:conserved hypothetical protein [Histoplasma capsulatum var. duboisii H88]|uniref:Uncharacterized protein n=1 Tax=Ajellomyces capsulatus (strain H88) TaxID=544711 RepID=F0UIP4_AJEC8|nr:conserved hypothetical protein [Histoplasma capsulatum var. duboisii H88]